jgi:hypothetical protein
MVLYLDMKVGTAIKQINSVPTLRKMAEIEAAVVVDIFASFLLQTEDY